MSTGIISHLHRASVSVQEIAADLYAIAGRLREQTGTHTVSPLYTDGTPKPYSLTNPHTTQVRMAQATWSFNDGEAAQ